MLEHATFHRTGDLNHLAADTASSLSRTGSLCADQVAEGIGFRGHGDAADELVDVSVGGARLAQDREEHRGLRLGG